MRRSTGFSHGSFQGDLGDSIPSTAAFQRVVRPPRAASPVLPPLPQRVSVCTHTDTETHRETPTDRHAETHMHTHRHRDTHRETDRQTCRHTHMHTHRHKETHTETHKHTHTLRANHGAVRGEDTRSQRFLFTLPAKKFHRPTGTHFPRKYNNYKRFPLLWWEVKVENVCFKPTLYHGCTFQVSREDLTNSKMAFP